MLRLPACLALCAAVALAQTPPAPPKAIPPPGISPTDAERAELAAGAATLRAEIDALAASPGAAAVLPDVEIFHKAVAWALRDDTLYTPKEIAFAKQLIADGRARVAQGREQRTPWLTAKGLVVRGYRSKLDGSIQPYGLVVPENFDPAQPTPVLVWTLGRGEKRTELAFLAERLAGPPPIAPQGTLVVVPYGRFCNATKFAGEVDVFEALAAVRAQYKVDARRIAVAGFSMGGGSTWHLATHFPGVWCAASPGAGFAETPIFTKASAPNKEPRPAWEQLLWRQYEGTGIAGNLFNCPTLAYSGEIDAQKEAADLMEAAMAREGLKLERFIGPQTAHRYHEDTKAALTKRFEELIAAGQPPSRREIRFSTYTLRYAECDWLRIEGLEKHWERADVHAKFTGDHELAITTRNVTSLFVSANPARLVIDGQVLAPVQPTAPTGLHVTRENGQWALRAPGGVRKSPGLTGPVDDAFMEPFVFVRPSGRPLNAEVGAWAESELTAARKLWREVFRGEVPVKSDTTLSDDDIASKNLVLWGDPSSNKVLAKILARLPLTWNAQALVFRGKSYPAASHAPILVFPNPLNPRRYVVVNSGLDFRADGYGNNALQTPKLPDWAVVDLRTAPGPRWPGRIVDAGFFDEAWR